MLTAPLAGYSAAVYITRMEILAITASPVPVPGALWLFGPGLLGLASFGRRKKSA